jgi:hypothetical protein
MTRTVKKNEWQAMDYIWGISTEYFQGVFRWFQGRSGISITRVVFYAFVDRRLYVRNLLNLQESQRSKKTVRPVRSKHTRWCVGNNDVADIVSHYALRSSSWNDWVASSVLRFQILWWSNLVVKLTPCFHGRCSKFLLLDYRVIHTDILMHGDIICLSSAEKNPIHRSST